jgi:hypothetical protein
MQVNGMLTVFSWGYEGWGNATRQLAQSFNLVEESRGFGPPVFVDVRIRRQVRAIGFRDDAFQRTVGIERYRWLPGLGNDAVRTGRGPMRLRSVTDALELLGVALAQNQKGRRVVFFCSCGSPERCTTCHRQLVRKALVTAARRANHRLLVQEWPGGELTSRTVDVLRLKPQMLRAVQAGRRAIPLTKRLPPLHLLALPHYSVVRPRAGGESQLVSALAARFSAGMWRLPIGLSPVEPEDTRTSLMDAAQKTRRRDQLEAFEC